MVPILAKFHNVMYIGDAALLVVTLARSLISEELYVVEQGGECVQGTALFYPRFVIIGTYLLPKGRQCKSLSHDKIHVQRPPSLLSCCCVYHWKTPRIAISNDECFVMMMKWSMF